MVSAKMIRVQRLGKYMVRGSGDEYCSSRQQIYLTHLNHVRRVMSLPQVNTSWVGSGLVMCVHNSCISPTPNVGFSAFTKIDSVLFHHVLTWLHEWEVSLLSFRLQNWNWAYENIYPFPWRRFLVISPPSVVPPRCAGLLRITFQQYFKIWTLLCV